MNKQIKNRKSITSLLLIGAAIASAPTYAEVKISGQVSAALLFGGDVENPEIVDNAASGSRFRFRASEKVNDATTAFALYEIQVQENSSFGAVDGSESIDTRQANAGIKGSFGKISLGKGDGASNGTAEATFFLSGNVYGAGPLPFFSYKGTLEKDNPDTKVGWTYYDGFSRVSRLRYDSPSFGGLTISASLDTKDRNELAARYKGNVGIGKLLVYAGQANSSDGNNDRSMLSGGLELNNGLFVTAAFNKRTSNVDAEQKSQLLSIGYKAKNFVVSADVGESGLDGENEVTSFGGTYNLSKSTRVYANTTKYDNSDGSSLKGNMIGIRYAF